MAIGSSGFPSADPAIIAAASVGSIRLESSLDEQAVLGWKVPI